MSTQDIKTTIAEYFKTQPVLKAWLFGSFARGEETPDSDVDILVEDGTMRPLIAEDANYDRQLIYERAI